MGSACYPDQQCTPLVQLSQEVVRTLLDAGCTNQAAVVAAALGDLPYSRTMWRDQVQYSTYTALATVHTKVLYLFILILLYYFQKIQ